MDLILKGGRVIDPSQGLDGVMDVGFAKARWRAIAPQSRRTAAEVRDVSAMIVSPGLIDLHTHVYWGGTSLGIDAEEFCRTAASPPPSTRAPPGPATSWASASM
jgi:dihydroorotase